MSGRSEQRLNAVAGVLTPKEAVLAWMADAHAFPSVFAYVASLQDAAEEAFPLVRLGRQMEEAVRRTRKGQPKDEVWHAVRMAVRDAGFLYFLTTNLNLRAIEHARAHWLHIALVAEMLRSALEEASERCLHLWWEQAQQAAQTAYVQQGHGDVLAREYFDGVEPLFPATAADVANQVAEIERVISIYNAGFQDLRRPRSKRGSLFPAPVDLAQLRKDAASALQAEKALVVDLSKAEAWNLIGEWQSGLAQLGPHVWSGSA